MPDCLISLGGNSGPRAATFDQALGRLQHERSCRVVAVSSYRETAAVGDQAGGGFLNAAAQLETGLPPLELLDTLQAVEQELGRTRSLHWGPRTLDLDLLFYESQIIDSPRLIVPHPAAWYRRFVLDPLVEIAATLVHPVKQVALGALRDRLLARPLRVSLAGSTPDDKRDLVRLLSPIFAAVEFSDWDSASLGVQAIEPALIFWLGPKLGFRSPVITGDENPISTLSDFERLPPLARIDATVGLQPVHDFVRYVIQSALG